jgi:hypothetical protein
MKRISILMTLLMLCHFAFAQNIGINSTGATPAASAMLDISSSNSGLLVPRVALTATNAAGPISAPATSLLVYNTATAGAFPNNVVPGYYYWNSVNWIAFSSASNTAWTLTGNSGLNAATNFIGTTDDKPLVFKTFGNSFLEFGNRGTLGLTQGYTDYDNATEKVTYIRSALQFEAAAASFYKPKMYTDTDGNFRVKGSSAGTDYFEFGSTGTSNGGGFEFIIGDDGDEPILFKSYHYVNGMSEIMRLQSGRMAVGSNAFDGTNPEKLLIDAGATSSYNLMTGKGSIDNYLQINIKNSSNTANASSDVVATASNGTESSNYIDFGINSGAYTNVSYPVLAGANTAYLYATGSDFVIGNATAAKPVRFFTGGTANTNERMRIDGTGKVGIGTIAPTEALDITGNLEVSGAFMPGNSAGTSGYLLSSAGTNTAPTWINPSTALSTSFWALGGNSVVGVSVLGTISNFALPFITNNTEKMRISAIGDVGIGTSAFTAANPEQLIVDAGTPAVATDFQNVIVGKGNTNSYAQLNIQNINAGLNASSDVVATANNGSESNFFVDLGINSSINNSGVMGGANDAYLYNLGQNFLIGTGTAAKSLIFMTGGTTQASNERMRIDGTGKVGIGKTVPTEALDITGNLRFSGAFMPNNLPGGAGDVLISSGAGFAPTWLSPGSILSTISWALNGNAVAGVTTIGTTSNFALPFITNNTEKMRISATGDVGIGTSSFTGANPEQLIVDAGAPAVATDFQNVIVGKGNTNSYAQLNIQNINAGLNASSDVVATANNGSESNFFVDLGINSSVNNSGVMGGANDAYLYNLGQNFLIGTGTAAKSLIFMTGGTAQGTNERMRIDGNGKLGVGTVGNTSSAVNSTLEVVGSVGFGIVTIGTNTTLTLDATNYTAIMTASTPTINFPAAAASNARRIYVIVNQTGTARTTSAYLNFSGASVTTTAANSSITIQSNGANWYRIQ